MDKISRGNETLNKAIFMVIDCPRKADVKVYHVMVEEAGYKIERYKGHYNVQNEATGRRVNKASNDYRDKDNWVVLHSRNPRNVPYLRASKIDYVSFLDTQDNDFAYRPREKYELKMLELKYLLRERKYRIRDVEERKAQLRHDEERLIDSVKYLCKAEDELKNFMKALKED